MGNNNLIKMIARKPQKFSLNSSETTALKLPKEDSSSFFNQHRNKTAAETATSILEDLGINKSSENETAKSNAGYFDGKTEQKIYLTKNCYFFAMKAHVLLSLIHI